VIAPDDKPLAVALRTAARLHVRRLYVLGANDDDAGFIDLAGLPPTGLRFVGRATWASRHFDAVAARVVRARADGVFVTGPLDTGTGAMIKALRRRLGGEARILAGVTATPVPELLRYAGRAAVGMYIVTNAPPYDALTKPGKRWVERFAGSEQGRGVGAYAPMAAQATEVMLAAIARSDGTRAAVTRELLRTRVKDGILGDFSFTPVGDVTPARIAVLRVLGPAAAASGTLQPDYAGAVVDRVVTVP
jgi:ABC-type branched-subunit amino acid transport system substrate-binding protein